MCQALSWHILFSFPCPPPPSLIVILPILQMKKQVMEGQSMPSDAVLLLASVNLSSSNREGSAVVEGMNSGSQMTCSEHDLIIDSLCGLRRAPYSLSLGFLAAT